VKNETESAFMMLLFLGFHAGEISMNAYTFKYFWILSQYRGKVSRFLRLLTLASCLGHKSLKHSKGY
jgi:hypothetical protein